MKTKYSGAQRNERDTFGEIAVPADALWGAQTQRSLHHFAISTETMPPELVLALARVKRSCAQVNSDLGLLDGKVAGAIAQAVEEVLAGTHAAEFPLSVWQTGSGTQSNMNMNEVLANRASEYLGGTRGMSRVVHPNDHVNMGQSSNDVFPTAMHVAAAAAVIEQVLPSLKKLRTSLDIKAKEFADIIKIGRTHLQDATPLTLGQEISGWVAQLDYADKALRHTLPALQELAIGGTAVGTGLNTHADFGELVAASLTLDTGVAFSAAPNRFGHWLAMMPWSAAMAHLRPWPLP